MPSINQQFINQYVKTRFSTFVETGTYEGETIFEMEAYFDELYTIEISPPHYESAKAKYKGNKINFILGDSSVELRNLIHEKISNQKTVYFLDGHWSGPGTGKGTKDCPLYEELQEINQYHAEECIIIIDDARMFERGPGQQGDRYDVCDWQDINKKTILDIVKNRVIEYSTAPSIHNEEDRIIIRLGEKK